MSWVPPPAILAACAVVLALFVAAILLLDRRREPSEPARSGDHLRAALDADMGTLERVWQVAQREIVMGHPRAHALRQKALAFSQDLDEDLARIEEYFRTAIADAPLPGDGLPGTLADEGESLHFAAMVAATRLLVRGLERCDDLDAGVARLRRAVDAILLATDVAVVATEAAEANGRA